MARNNNTDKQGYVGMLRSILDLFLVYILNKKNLSGLVTITMNDTSVQIIHTAL